MKKQLLTAALAATVLLGAASIAKADDCFIIEGDRLLNYSYKETPSSPQFILYSLSSPEHAVIWHGIGEFGASQLVKSYTSIHVACTKNYIFQNLKSLSKDVKLEKVRMWESDKSWCEYYE